ncbi:hypothetical protein D9757_003620 [Collybiopsis confluens]|uniref:Uncharacterized protein n=1 Tax=Collybiopsis confluens TaxID=2823264 RepID=A0A8H5MDJ2_9AGAR|nr:hypothetical protein D9757_003620 [Collybiopsis confluens]
MQGLLQLLVLLASNAFLARALPIVERGSSVSSFTLSGWNDLCGSCFSSDLYFSNLCFELGSVGWNFALSESADVCVQQQVADQMIFLAKSSSISVSESSTLIAYAVGFNELPRSVGHVVGFGRSVSACTVAPVNPELSGSSSVGISSGSISNGPISSIPTGSSSSSSIPVSGSSGVSSGSLGDGSSTDFNSTDISGNSTLTGSDSTNGTDLTGSNSTDTSNSTLTGTDSTNSTDTSGSDSTDASSTDSTDTSTATDSSIDTATATDTSAASTTDSSTAATATSSQTFDGNIHDPAGRKRRNSIRRL